MPLGIPLINVINFDFSYLYILLKIIFVVIIPRDMKFSACEHNGV